jgi:hypothetical protein
MNLADSTQRRSEGRFRWSRWVLGPALAVWLVASIAPASAWATNGSRQLVSAIDARTEGRPPLRERALDGFSAEGARVTAWGTRGAIEKVSVEGLGERGRVLIDFYWKRGQLVAAHSRRIDYGAHITELPKGQPTPTTVVEDERLEFTGDRLVRMREGERERPVADASARRRGAEVKASARSFRRLVETPARGSAAGSCAWSCTSERGGECFRYVCK